MSRENIAYGDYSDDMFWKDLLLLRNVSESSEWILLERSSGGIIEPEVNKLVRCFQSAISTGVLQEWTSQFVQACEFRAARSALVALTNVRIINVLLRCERPDDTVAAKWQDSIKHRIRNDRDVSSIHNAIFIVNFSYAPPIDHSLDALRFDAINYLLR